MIRHSGEHIHMIGIGGAGMSPVAELLHTLGYTITGSDRQSSPASDRLEQLGIAIQHDHAPALIRDAALVVYSSAIRETNDERAFARANGIRQIRRAEILGDLMRMQTTVCIAGTHGKTTTTSMTGTLLMKAGLDPTVLIGGMLRGHGTHAIIGKGGLMVAEADEFDRSFLAMHPTVAVITNIDEDHLDCYRDIGEIRDAFLLFVKKLPFYGTVIACADDEGVRAILPAIEAKTVTYGIDAPGVAFGAADITYSGGCATFTLLEGGVNKGELTLAVPGTHNVRNALASVAVARLFGVDLPAIRAALAEFGGVHRRFEVRGVVNGITVVDDYAHHPREIRATLDAARKVCSGRVLAVFQPHLYSRTRDFMHEFAQALLAADTIVVTDIYKSREEPIEGVHARGIVEQCRSLGHADVRYVADREAILSLLRETGRAGDYAVFMGAGDINDVAGAFAEVTDGKA